MNYGELKTEAENISHRSDFSADWAGWIPLVESIIRRDLRCVEMLLDTTLDETNRVSDELYALPATFVEERLVKTPSGVSGKPLRKLSYTSIYAYERSTTLWGYAVTGTVTLPRMVFIGTPATDVEIDVNYFGLTGIDTADDSDETEILAHHPEIYLHGLLFYAYQKSQDLELAQAHADQLTEAIRTANELAGRQIGGTVTKPVYNLGHSLSGGY